MPKPDALTVDVKVVSAEHIQQDGKLLVQPGTITGSIGVIYGKLNIAGGLDKVDLCHIVCVCIPCYHSTCTVFNFSCYTSLSCAPMQVGITTDIVAKGDNAAATSPFTDFTKQQLVQVQCPCTCMKIARM